MLENQSILHNLADKFLGKNEIQLLGNMLISSGLLAGVGGLAIEVVTEGDIGKLVASAGLGAAAIGGVIRAAYRN